MTRTIITVTIAAIALSLQRTDAFVIAPPAVKTTSNTALNGWLDNAFKNDDSLGKPDNPGLKGGPQYNEQVTVNGIPVKGAVVGQKLTVVAGRARVKIPVNCQKGDCGTCMVKFNGRKVKACQTTLGSGKATIQTL